MDSIEVIDNEVQVLTRQKEDMPGKQITEFLNFKLSALFTKKNYIETEIQSNRLTDDDYIDMIVAEFQKDKKLLEKRAKINNKLTSALKDELAQRISKRQQIINKELSYLRERKRQKEKEIQDKIQKEIEEKKRLQELKEKEIQDKKQKEIEEQTLKKIREQNKRKREQEEQKLQEQKRLEEQRRIEEERRQEELMQQEIERKRNELIAKIKNFNERMIEYQKAITYFETMNITEKVKEATEKANIIEEAITKLKNNEEFDESSLPPVITSEFVSGNNKLEKMKQYDKIIFYFLNRKAEKEDNLNSIKKYDTSELEPEMQKRVENTNKKFKDILDKEIQRAVEVVLTIPKFIENPWIPVPLFEKIQGQEFVEVINQDVAENTIFFKIVKIEKEGQPFGDFVVLFLPWYPMELITITDENLNRNNCIYEQIIQLKPEEMKQIHQQNIELVIYKKNNFKNTQIGKIAFKLDFTEHCTINENYPVFLLTEEGNEKTPPQIKIKAKVRQSLYALEYEVIQKEMMEITKIYPPFKTENDKIEKSLNPYTEGFEDPKLSPQIQYNDINIECNNESIIEETEFTQDEINEPQQIKYLQLDKLSEDLRTILNETNPKELVKDYKNAQLQIKQIVNKIEDGEFFIEQYLSTITKTLNHEKRLLTFFTQKLKWIKWKL